MWPCCVRNVPQGPDLKLKLAEELLASMAQCCRHPVSPLEDKGMRRLLCMCMCMCICELGCDLVCHRMSDNTTG